MRRGSGPDEKPHEENDFIVDDAPRSVGRRSATSLRPFYRVGLTQPEWHTNARGFAYRSPNDLWLTAEQINRLA